MSGMDRLISILVGEGLFCFFPLVFFLAGSFISSFNLVKH